MFFLVLRCFFWSWDVNFTRVSITQVLFESAHKCTIFPSYLGMYNQYSITPNDCPLLPRNANWCACWLILGKWHWGGIEDWYLISWLLYLHLHLLSCGCFSSNVHLHHIQVNLSPSLVEANVGEPHLLRGKNWSEREEVRIIVTIMMTIFIERRWGWSW